MTDISYNVSWMIYNSILALIPVAAGFFLLQTPWRIVKICLGVIWFFFLPNTVYMLTDIVHFPMDWYETAIIYRPLLIMEYALLMIVAITTYTLAMYPFDVLLHEHLKKKGKKKLTKKQLIIFFNSGVAFAMVLGRIERANSWDVLLRPLHVLQDTVHVLTSGDQLLLLFLYGVLVNCIYFSSQNVFRLLDGRKR